MTIVTRSITMQEELNDVLRDEGRPQKVGEMDQGRRDVENNVDDALGLVDNEEDYGALLLIGVSYGKELVIDFDCSFHICCKKKKIY